eukprot:scaffold48270_cov69-Phaeocystis_antarctica.AAC.6
MKAVNIQRTLTWPPSSTPYEPGEATTRVPSVAYGLGVTKRPSGACSASTPGRFSPPTPRKYSLGYDSPTRAPCVILGCLRHCYSPGTLPLTPRRAPRCPTEAVAGAAPLGTWRRSGWRRLKSVGGRRRDGARAERCLRVGCDKTTLRSVLGFHVADFPLVGSAPTYLTN